MGGVVGRCRRGDDGVGGSEGVEVFRRTQVAKWGYSPHPAATL